MKGYKKPTGNNRYLARDGLYYNGYLGSTDAAEDAFGPAMKEISEKIQADLDNPDLWNEDGTAKEIKP